MQMQAWELLAAWDAKLLHDWDQTAAINQQLYQLLSAVCSFGKVRLPQKQLGDFHPYRKSPPSGLRITKQNFGVLRHLGNAMVTK